MKIKQALPALAAGVLTAALVFLIVGPVVARSALDIFYPVAKENEQAAPATPAGPVFYEDTRFNIPAAAFAADGVNPDSTQFVFNMGPLLSGSGGYIVGNAQAYGCVQAPVYLPQGESIQQMEANLYDNDTNHSIDLRLHRSNRNSGADEILLSISTGQAFATPSIQSLTANSVNPIFVDNQNYHYYLRTCLQSSQTALYGAAVKSGIADLAVGILTEPGAIPTGTTSVRYSIFVINLGTTDMVGTSLDILMPANIPITNYGGIPCNLSQNLFECNLGTLAAGDSAALQVYISPPASFVGNLTAQATVLSLTADDFPANNISTSILTVGPPNYLPIITRNAGLTNP
jgi:hypothetical protein